MQIEQLFDYFSVRSSLGESTYEAEYYHKPMLRFQSVYQRYRFMLSGLEKTQQLLLRKTELVFVGFRFIDLIHEGVRAKRALTLVSGLGEYTQALREGVLAIPLWNIRAMLDEVYVELQKGKPIPTNQMIKIQSEAERLLEKIEPKSIVLWNDVGFVERLLIWVARRMGIPTFVIQHGLYMGQLIDPRIVGGDWVDYNLMWGKHFERMFLNKGIASKGSTEVLGYPYPIRQLAKPSMAFTVCIMGEDWERYDPSLVEPKWQYVNHILGVCQELDLPVVYRPHPGERREYLLEFLPASTLTPLGESLWTAIERYSVFVSLTSTSLVEVGLRNRLAVQVVDSRFIQDNFLELGVCYSIQNNPDSLKTFFEAAKLGTINPMPVSEDYVSVSKSPIKRLLELVEQLPREASASHPKPVETKT